MVRILIVDDFSGTKDVLTEMLAVPEYQVQSAQTLQEAYRCLQQGAFDIVLLDVNLPDGNGIAALPRIRHRENPPDVIVMTGDAHREDAITSLNNGAWDYLQKPLDRRELLTMLERLVQYRHCAARAEGRSLSFDTLQGASGPMRAAIRQLSLAADGESPVHLYGETGTGKDLAARLIHAASARSKEQFVVVDCATLSDMLGQSHLFGHVKGAFTGAVSGRDGLIAQAHGGTLFLDEVGELSLELQKIFLRVLQEKSYTPVGSNTALFSDFRIISATNRNLPRMVQEGLFREDLFYRLRGIAIEMPPLRDRKEDISLLAEKRCQQLADRSQRVAKNLAPECVMALHAHHWPGNVRELFSVIDAAVQLAGEYPALLSQHLPVPLRLRTMEAGGAAETVGSSCVVTADVAPHAEKKSNKLLLPDGAGLLPTLKEAREKLVGTLEKNYLLELMNLVGNDVREACAISGLSRSRLYMYLQKYDIRRHTWQ